MSVAIPSIKNIVTSYLKEFFRLGVRVVKAARMAIFKQVWVVWIEDVGQH